MDTSRNSYQDGRDNVLITDKLGGIGQIRSFFQGLRTIWYKL